MTRIYEFHRMPHRVDMTCPACRKRAEFEFAEVVSIKLKADRPYFEQNSLFETRKFEDLQGRPWYGACYFEGLHGDPRLAIHALPAGYAPGNWSHPSTPSRDHDSGDIGSVRCAHCGARGKHMLDWPADACYSIGYRGHALWAYNRDCAAALLAYLSSTDRKSYGGWTVFLLHLPTVFKVRKARDTLARRWKKILDAE